MRFLTAEKIHNGQGWLPDGSVLEVADNGAIISISNEPNNEAVFYEGILAPGFVNVHCHLELCHMKGLIPEHTNLIPFLKNIPLHRNDFTEEQKKAARHEGYSELVRNGIVAVGDIANTTDSLDVRALDQLHCYTFVESLGFNAANAARSFNYAIATYNTYATQHAGEKLLKQAIVPHAPYSVSSALFKLIDGHKDGVTIAIHNQESEEENKYFTTKEGSVPDLLHAFGIDDSLFTPSGRSSLQSYLEWLSPGHPMIFVHNTYTKREDVQFAQGSRKEVFWCLCPNANLYIENKLPDVEMFVSEGANICIGTDSLASNHQLCVLSELYSIKEQYPQISWETLLTWGTMNGAMALQLHDVVGTIETGKKPGIVQITGINALSARPAVVRII